MPKNIFNRLREYYLKVAEVLRGDAESASIFPNTTDIGISRERVYAEFLRLHAPSKCNVFLGGFLFDIDGNESKQLDVIITTDTTPRFDLHNHEGGGKSFSPVEGCIGVVSSKSTLDKKELHDALSGIASIPEMQSLEGRLSFTTEIPHYEEWPYRIIYANDGLKGETILNHINKYYDKNPNIPLYRRPSLIHVAGKYVIMKCGPGMKLSSSDGIKKPVQPELGSYALIMRDPDLHGILWALNSLQENAAASSEILFNYGPLMKKIQLAPNS